jgi:uncharacterized heparinase superfamily protein
MQLLRYWHTLKYLKIRQIAGRAVFLLRKPRVVETSPPPLRTRTNTWCSPARKPRSHLHGNRFTFLNVEREVVAATDWNHPQWDKLWLYNLHYFSDIDTADFQRLAQRWIAENPTGVGNGWEPYPMSLRIVNWIKRDLAGEPASAAMRASLAMQARYLLQRIEWHLLGNHLLANAKALLFAGLYHSGAEADHWLTRGMVILQAELKEQVLSDGGHFELSPMYHSIILEDFLDLYNLATVYSQPLLQARLLQVIRPMLRWLRQLTLPDGEIALFNDSAFDIAAVPQELHDYAVRLQINADNSNAPQSLTTSGYQRVERGPACAILDVAAVGPDYLPGHAHADTLSFELCLWQQRVIVNSGTSTYAAGPQRDWQRSTAAHNTVIVDAENSSEVWGSFRVARRARPLGLKIQSDREKMQISCAHSGYCRLPGKVVHRRTWNFLDDSMQISDELTGSFGNARARFYFHPQCQVSLITSQNGDIRLPRGLPAVRWSIEGGTARLLSTHYYPRFGESHINSCLEIEFAAKSLSTLFRWGL